jgi:hypothetical protein
MSSPNPAARKKPRVSASRWDAIPDPDERRQLTQKARDAHRRKVRKVVDRRVAELLELAPEWTTEHRERIVGLLRDEPQRTSDVAG